MTSPDTLLTEALLFELYGREVASNQLLQRALADERAAHAATRERLAEAQREGERTNGHLTAVGHAERTLSEVMVAASGAG